jgi:tRNA (guanine37-N1)-methyltransferase
MALAAGAQRVLKIDVITIFPRMVEAGLAEGVVGRARTAGLLDIVVHNLRDFTTDKHHVVDDVPFGGGPGMVMKPEPFFAALASIGEHRGKPDAVLMLTPAGAPFTQAGARRLAGINHLVFLCGRYEGIDERVREALATEEISIGDYVLSGGEVPALAVIDAVARLVPGVVGDDQSVEADSFTRGLLDYPHYTRPAEYDGRKVPEVLLSGHHGEIRRWRRETALQRTVERRPDLLADATLDADEREWLKQANRPAGRQADRSK